MRGEPRSPRGAYTAVTSTSECAPTETNSLGRRRLGSHAVVNAGHRPGKRKVAEVGEAGEKLEMSGNPPPLQQKTASHAARAPIKGRAAPPGARGRPDAKPPPPPHGRARHSRSQAS